MRVVMIKSDVRAREKPCLRCGYSLRKIDAQHCPECGLSVWLSLNQNVTLEWSNPEWLRRMVRGLWVMVVAQAIGVAAYGVAMANVLPMMQYRQEVERVARSAAAGGDEDAVAAAVQAIPKPRRRDPNLASAAAMLAGIYLASYHGGLLLLVRNENRYPDRMATPRVFARVASGFAALVALGVVGWVIRPTQTGWVELGVKGAVIFGAIVTWTYLRLVARRVPHATLARVCAWLLLLPILSVLKVFPFCAVFVVREFAWVVDFLPAVYGPVSIGLFVWFARVVGRAVRSAAESWEKETAGGVG